MVIKIEALDRTDVVLVRHGKRLGYRCRFSCPDVEGAAVLVPYTGHEAALQVGRRISVETDQESVSDFRVVPNDTPIGIQALPVDGDHTAAGDYAVVGTVMLNTQDVCFDLGVNEVRLALDIDETRGVVPQVGQRVAFTLHGLSLWDEHLI